MRITEEEYEALMDIREKAYGYSERMDSGFIASIADRLNDIVLNIMGK